MSARRFVALYDGLGVDTASYRAALPDTWHWTTEHELLALLAELVDQGNRQFVIANSREGAQPPKPIKLTRPGQNSRSQGTTLDELLPMMKPKG